MKQFIVSPAPHFHSGDSVRKNMLLVIIALLPAYAVSVWQFGWGALITTAISVAACVLFEWLIAKYILKQKSTICDLSAVLTGLLLAFNLPSNLPWWIVVIGALVAIGVAKMSFGGLGQNLFNPALVGRVFLLISFPAQMTTWPVPRKYDGTTGATPLGILNEGGTDLPTNMDMFLGFCGGSMGEVSAVALLIGGLFLIWKKVISPIIPFTFIGTVFVFAFVYYSVAGTGDAFEMAVFHILAGGVMLGAFFMATDYVTSPLLPMGKVIFGVGCGLITMLIRVFGSYPEGVSFSILIMNCLTPLINDFCQKRMYGGAK